MAHKLQPDFPEKGRVKGFSLPSVSGRFGFSLFVGMKEVFIGIMISDVTLESVIRKRVVKISKGKVKTFGFDPLS